MAVTLSAGTQDRLPRWGPGCLHECSERGSVSTASDAAFEPWYSAEMAVEETPAEETVAV